MTETGTRDRWHDALALMEATRADDPDAWEAIWQACDPVVTCVTLAAIALYQLDATGSDLGTLRTTLETAIREGRLH